MTVFHNVDMFYCCLQIVHVLVLVKFNYMSLKVSVKRLAQNFDADIVLLENDSEHFP